MNILVSACLLGANCRYNGGGELREELVALSKEHHLVPICPEIYGGLATPRDPAEIVEDKVITCNGQDVTAQYEKGAEEVVKLASLLDCQYAIMKERSPSCGYGKVYDGTFSKVLIDGNGRASDLLAKNGVQVFGESQIAKLAVLLDNTNKNILY